MANRDIVRGAVPINSASGTHSGVLRKMFAEASQTMAIGDIVALAGAADSSGRYPTVVKVTPSLVPVGIVVGFEFDANASVDKKYKESADDLYVLVNTDPNVKFLMQADDATANITAANIGLHADIIDAGVNTSTGASGMEVDLNTLSASADLHLCIEGIAPRVDNELGASADLICSFSQHEYAGKGQAGVS